MANFSTLFLSGFQASPTIHAQNRRHSSPISLSGTQSLFTPIFCLRGRATFGKRGFSQKRFVLLGAALQNVGEARHMELRLGAAKLRGRALPGSKIGMEGTSAHGLSLPNGVLFSHMAPRVYWQAGTELLYILSSGHAAKMSDWNQIRGMIWAPPDLRPRWPGTSVKTAEMPRSAYGRVLKVIWSFWAESPKRVSRTVQTLFRTGRNTPKHSFAPCKRLFWDSHSGGPKTPFALSLNTFGHFGCFDTCTRPAGVPTPDLCLPRCVFRDCPCIW